MIFNIYYINFPKVYEIKMMLGNVIQLNKELEKNKNIDGGVELGAKFDIGTKFFKLFNIEGEGKGRVAGSSSQKVLETFEIKTTKSVILNEVIEKSLDFKDFDTLSEGSLVKIDNVRLSLENESELRTVKLFTSGTFKGMNIPGANGLDMNSLLNSMFKDYSYKIRGVIKENDAEIIIKIPLTFESEFESSYNVDDLFIGKVSVVGLYKGKIKAGALKNSFEFFQELGTFQNTPSGGQTEEVKEIQDSQYTAKKNDISYFFSSSEDVNKEYHYVDLLAVIQNVSIPSK